MVVWRKNPRALIGIIRRPIRSAIPGVIRQDSHCESRGHAYATTTLTYPRATAQSRTRMRRNAHTTVTSA